MLQRATFKDEAYLDIWSCRKEMEDPYFKHKYSYVKGVFVLGVSLSSYVLLHVKKHEIWLVSGSTAFRRGVKVCKKARRKL